MMKSMEWFTGFLHITSWGSVQLTPVLDLCPTCQPPLQDSLSNFLGHEDCVGCP